MYKIKFLFCFVLFLLQAGRLFAGLTLEECKELALANSETIAISDLRLLIAQDRVDEISGIAYPHLSFHADYVAAGAAHKFLKKHKTANAKASLIVPLYNFGGAQNAITAQKKLYDSSLFDSDRIRQELLYHVAQAFYQLLEAQKIGAVVCESLSTLQEQLRISNDFLNEGLLHRNDMLLIEVQLAQRRQDALQAQLNCELALAQLNRLIGAPLEQPTEISDCLEEQASIGNFCEILSEARASHPELLSLRFQITASQYAYQAEKGALYPKIYAFSDYSTTNDYSFPYTHGINVGLAVDIDLYDGGTTWAKIRRLNKETAELEARYQALEEDIALNIKSAYLQFQSACGRIPLALRGVSMAEENLKITQDHYKEGFVTIYELLNDEEGLAEARSNYYQALYELHKAQTDLNYASGKG